MKIVLHNNETILSVIEDCFDVHIKGDVVRWNHGEIRGLQTEVAVVPDDFAIKQGDPSEVLAGVETDQSIKPDELEVINQNIEGLQMIDSFTLQKTIETEERAAGLQEIDEFTLELVMEQKMLIDQMRLELDELKGTNQ